MATPRDPRLFGAAKVLRLAARFGALAGSFNDFNGHGLGEMSRKPLTNNTSATLLDRTICPITH
jgi:hypothetical protein